MQVSTLPRRICRQVNISYRHIPPENVMVSMEVELEQKKYIDRQYLTWLELAHRRDGTILVSWADVVAVVAVVGLADVLDSVELWLLHKVRLCREQPTAQQVNGGNVTQGVALHWWRIVDRQEAALAEDRVEALGNAFALHMLVLAHVPSAALVQRTFLPPSLRRVNKSCAKGRQVCDGITSVVLVRPHTLL